MAAKLIPAEINTSEVGGILLVGWNPSKEDDRMGRAFSGSGGRLLNDCLLEAGLSRDKVNLTYVVPFASDDHPKTSVDYGLQELRNLIQRLRPNIVVCFGAAAAALVADWPCRKEGMAGAYGIEDRRGYIWEGWEGIKVLTTIAPDFAFRIWTPWRTLLAADLEKAKEEAKTPEIVRPVRNVQVASSMAEAEAFVARLNEAEYVAVDIETIGTDELACVGFAVNGEEAYVFPSRYIELLRKVLTSETPRKIFQNGSYDTYWLRSRLGIDVGGYTDDTMIGFHSCYPELAGKSEHGSKRTHKSLKFLASLYCGAQRFWKDYDFETEMQRYELNGIDCCVTYDAWVALRREIRDRGVEPIYHATVARVRPCTFMLERGIKVDEELRRSCLTELEAEKLRLNKDIQSIAAPLMEMSLQKRLFKVKDTCGCCRNGKGKRERCWECAGFDHKPKKVEMLQRSQILAPNLDPVDATWMKADELAAALLKPCVRCAGVGATEWYEFNPVSVPQKIDLLYNVLKLQRRFVDGKVSTDEDALKANLAMVMV